MKRAIVISAFPACGKSFVAANNTNERKVILDSDSSSFSWEIHPDGSKTRNPNFPENYIQYIKDNLETADIIFVSSHLEVRKALMNAGIDFCTVYPEPYLKEEWVGRCYLRGNDNKFLDFIATSWDKFMDNIWKEPHGSKLYFLGQRMHLSDILNKIVADYCTGGTILHNVTAKLKDHYNSFIHEFGNEEENGISQHYPLYKFGDVEFRTHSEFCRITVNLGTAGKYNWDFIKQKSAKEYVICRDKSIDYDVWGKRLSNELGISGPELCHSFSVDTDGNIVFSVLVSVPVIDNTI